MKNILIVSFIIFGASCSDGLEGECTKNIPLSAKSINFSASQDSTIVTTGKNQWWWLSDINVDGVEYHNFDNVDVTSHKYVIVAGILTFERIDGTSFLLKVDQNTSSQDRDISVTLQEGNCFNYVSIT